MAFNRPLYLRGFGAPRPNRVKTAGALAFVAVVAVANYLVFFHDNTPTEPSLDQRLARPVEAPTEDFSAQADVENTVTAEPHKTVEGTLARGETAAGCLKRMGVPLSSASAAVESLSNFVDMRTLKPGQKFVADLADDGSLQSLVFPVDEITYISASLEEDGWVATKKNHPTEMEQIEFACMVKGSVHESFSACGVDTSLANVVTDLLGGQIDFFTDSRRGDVLRVVVEKESISGKFLRYGKVLGLLYEGKLVSASAFPMESQDGKIKYYDSEGRSVERPFIRSPLKYTKISSGFSRRRLHPILHAYTPHKAIDYAAPRGTPVHAIGDGKIVFAGRKGASGNLVVLQHQDGYQTYYAHLDYISKGLKSGERIKRHTQIGTVGSTGRATGPHLHYAVAHKGKFVHPRNLLDVKGEKIPDVLVDAFLTSVGRVTGQLKDLAIRGVDPSRS